MSSLGIKGQAVLETILALGLVLTAAAAAGGLGRDAYRRAVCARWAFEEAHQAMTGLRVLGSPPAGVRITVRKSDLDWEGIAVCGNVREKAVLRDPF